MSDSLNTRLLEWWRSQRARIRDRWKFRHLDAQVTNARAAYRAAGKGWVELHCSACRRVVQVGPRGDSLTVTHSHPTQPVRYAIWVFMP